MAPDLETIADTLPRRYREVLDTLDRVERLGFRDEACRWRLQAIERYSRAWDTATLAWMEAQVGRIRDFEAEREPLAESKAA
jgi:hypothetical protein